MGADSSDSVDSGSGYSHTESFTDVDGRTGTVSYNETNASYDVSYDNGAGHSWEEGAGYGGTYTETTRAAGGGLTTTETGYMDTGYVVGGLIGGVIPGMGIVGAELGKGEMGYMAYDPNAKAPSIDTNQRDGGDDNQRRATAAAAPKINQKLATTEVEEEDETLSGSPRSKYKRGRKSMLWQPDDQLSDTLG